MDWKGIPITDGTGQQDRQPVALTAGHFDVDELSFEKLLSMGAGVASGIQFYNLGNEIDGDWSDLFESDEAVVMAAILSADLKRIKAEFETTSSRNPDALPGFLLDLSAKINQWYLRLSACRNKPAELLTQKLATIINEKLVSELHNLGKLIEHTGIQTDGQALAEFDRIWGLNPPGSSDSFPKATLGDLDQFSDIKPGLSACFQVLWNSIAQLKTSAELFLQQSLDSGGHDPAIGLFMVFLRLYARAQQRLNRFTLRHLDFYYEQILKVKGRGQTPESCYLLLAAQAGRGKVRIEKDTEFSAGKDAALNEIIYCADEDLLVSDTRVESIATLYLQHDRLISPEAEFGFVTRMKSDLPLLSGPETMADEEQGEPVSWPLFGAEMPGDERGTVTDARIGFSIASALLLLEQGARKINLAIEFAPVAKIGPDDEISALVGSDSMQTFERRFSRLFARYLLTFKGCLSASQKSEIEARADALLLQYRAREIGALLTQDWQGLFYKLFRKIFSVKLTAENGWLDVVDYIVLPLSEDERQQKTGLRIELNLGQDIDPITPYNNRVHGGQLETGLPVLQCVINPLTNFYPYSVFRDLVIASFRIDVEVQGMKNLLAYNHHGQLDPSKPFQPFGPQPGGSSYFVVGNYELARKPLTDLNIELDWAELPPDAGGFDDHYQGYKTAYGNSSFKGSFSALADGRWMPVDPEARIRFNLFETESAGSRVAPVKVVDIDRLEYIKPVDGRLAASDFRYDLTARNGFFRMSLVAPDSAFGHGEYPQLLTGILSENARRKKQKPIPNPPYTPTLNGISLSYKASMTINPSVTAAETGEQSGAIFHLHPFGVETLFPSALEKPCFLMPKYEHEGNLFIGLSGRDVSGPVSLLFHLAQDRVPAMIPENTSMDWFYLVSNRWVNLPPEQVLVDTTHGFLASGKVTLNIPADIDSANSVMPGDHFWLRASTRQGAERFSSCYSVQPHALKVSKKIKLDAGFDTPLAEAPARVLSWSSLRALDGIDGIKQAYAVSGGRARETDDELKVRVSERLRHKNRALMPRDYEQLILGEFPEVMKAKCFNSISSTEDAIKPGQVLIVVVPHAESESGELCSAKMIGARQLDQIRTFVTGLCSPFASIEVRNPQYEQVQVRCSVKFSDETGDGVNISRLNQHISSYICPWKRTGYRARFGWSIRQQDIESYILGLGYVDSVTNFSMLHITVDNDEYYSLFDTADQDRGRKAVIRPRYPWSLALPMEKHAIEPIPVANSIPAEITGVDELAVGSTFIIVGSSEYGEEK